MFKAEALIEYVERRDCGSVGGMDTIALRNVGTVRGNGSIFDRWVLLVARESEAAEFQQAEALLLWAVMSTDAAVQNYIVHHFNKESANAESESSS
jgi:hypothetical protein